MSDRTSARSRHFRPAAVALAAVAMTVTTGFYAARFLPDAPKPAGAVPSVGGVPLFATWPKDKAPDVAVVLTGQTWGYLRPCGCSAGQRGGLERRANLIAGLKAKGWPVTAADLGDVAPPKTGVHEQNMLKYKYSMAALREMGYAAVGVGEYDINQQLLDLLARYTYQDSGDSPVVLCANLVGITIENGKEIVIPREKMFPPEKEGQRPAVDAIEVVDVGGIAVGFTSVVGKDMYERMKKIDSTLGFLENATVNKNEPGVLDQVTAALDAHPKKPAARILLYQGSKEDAVKIAAAFPAFHVILCQSTVAEAEPPQFPTVVNNGKTLIVQVGHKGMSAGVVGFFKTADGFDLKYQLVPLTEDFVTADDKVKDDKVIALLEQYALDVKKQNLLAQFTARPQPHAAQIQHPAANLTFVGSEKCQACHPGEYKVWKESKHSHAMEALEKYANRPSNRQFDGECVVCHSVGFGLVSGHVNDEKTPHLRHVGCENCHGPGSGHAANPTDKTLHAVLSPWKTKPDAKLPDKAILEKLAAVPPGQPAPVKVTPAQQQTMSAVSAACMKCHDPENDPKFDLNKYMPKVWHSGMKAAGLPPNAK